MTLDENKLKTIKESKIFLSFPAQFNDIIDSKLRYDDATKDYLVKKYLTNFQVHGNLDPIPIEQRKLQNIDFLQLQLNSTNICSFSLLDPMLTLSNHMWGLYADSGKGIVLQYELTKLLKHFVSESGTLANSLFVNTGIPLNKSNSTLDSCLLLPVKYSNKKNL
jgi:hypothetical protein